ncbi:hypothetical protein [Holdemania filiformis]|uniref:hypothetical protein n=1 Tax=Holdemania filiformis TaxID=61171 RepID=UPI002430C428|nr:hypothetical protein [Holdemania filiformis]
MNNSRYRMILYRAGSWLLIYLSISLGYWLSWGPELHSLRFYGEPWIQPGLSFVMISVGMMIVGLYLFWISNARQDIGSFATGLAVLLFLMTLMPLDDGYFAASVLLEILGIPHTLILKFLKGILGLGLPIGLVQTVAFLFQAGLTTLYLKKARKIRWGFIAIKLAVISVYALFSFYPDLNGEWTLSFFDLLNLIWLAELPWLGLDLSTDKSRKGSRAHS